MFIEKLKQLSEIGVDGITDVISIESIEKILEQYIIKRKTKAGVVKASPLEYAHCWENLEEDNLIVVQVNWEDYGKNVIGAIFTLDGSYIVEDGVGVAEKHFLLLKEVL